MTQSPFVCPTPVCPGYKSRYAHPNPPDPSHHDSCKICSSGAAGAARSASSQLEHRAPKNCAKGHGGKRDEVLGLNGGQRKCENRLWGVVGSIQLNCKEECGWTREHCMELTIFLIFHITIRKGQILRFLFIQAEVNWVQLISQSALLI